MTKNTQVETAQKSQATNKINTPTGKVKTLKSAEERRKTREEQFRNFRINALKRRCARYGFDEAKTDEYVEKLKKQMDTPKEYYILITFNQVYPRKKMKDGEVFKPDIEIFLDNIKDKNISYAYKGDSFVRIDGNKDILSKIREIAPHSAKIYPYAKKMESVIDEKPVKKEKKPTNNTPEKKATANPKRPMHKAVKSTRYMHHMQKGRYKNLREVFLAHKRSKKHKATTVQMQNKKRSEGSKKASKNLKKAA